MGYKRLPESQLTLYSELLDQAIQAAASEAASGILTGSYISKQIKGHTYWYLQKSQGTKKHQIYLGPESPSLIEWIEQAKSSTADIDAERRNLTRISRMLATGGATVESAATLKALRLLSESRVFQLGGVLIGTLAFRTYANVLGVRFEKSALQTQDLDIAHDPSVGVALSRETSATELEALISASGLDLHPVPPLDPRRPSTSFKVRGRELRIDFLTPMIGRESHDPVYLPAFGLSAQPLRHLGYLLEQPAQAVAVGVEPVLVNVPDPGRFAVHKLWTSTRRSPAFQAKSLKDIAQAEQLIDVLLDDRPDDLRQAVHALPNEKSNKAVSQSAARMASEVAARFLETTDLA